jgi:hypothetical protein
MASDPTGFEPPRHSTYARLSSGGSRDLQTLSVYFSGFRLSLALEAGGRLAGDILKPTNQPTNQPTIDAPTQTDMLPIESISAIPPTAALSGNSMNSEDGTDVGTETLSAGRRRMRLSPSFFYNSNAFAVVSHAGAGSACFGCACDIALLNPIAASK